MLVGELERKLLSIIPDEMAEPWDRTGMLVGNPESEVACVAVSLDPTLDAIDFARSHDCNVLLTHHPLFLDPPQEIKPRGLTHDAVGSRVWHAIEAGVSIISFHTALDANPLASEVLSRPLGIELTGEVLEGVPDHASYGYGRIGIPSVQSLGELSQRCVRAFGRYARVWGDAAHPIDRACCWTGAAGDSPQTCLDQGIDVLICGEVKYHVALDAYEQGLSIIELGHDVSEQVHCGVLIESLKMCGMPSDRVFLMPLPDYWS